MILLLVAAIGWMLYAAGRRHAAEDIVQAIDAKQAADKLEELARAGAKKALILACGGKLDYFVLARLTDAEIASAVDLALAPMGEARARLPPTLAVRMCEFAQLHRTIAQDDLAKAMLEQMAVNLDETIDGVVLALANDAIANAVKRTLGRKRPGELSDLEIVAGLDAATRPEDRRHDGSDEERGSNDIRQRALQAALQLRDKALK